MTDGSQEKAEVLNDYFSSVFTEEDTGDIPTLEKKHHGTPLTDIEITPEKVKNKLPKLKKTKSAGPDGFHPRILRECSEAICIPLSTIFQKSFRSSKLPSAWKDGNVIPIHKKGSRKSHGNYRPMSPTSVVGKLMKAIIRDAIVEHMMKNGLFCDEQHGFVPVRYCMTQLIEVIDMWTAALDEGAQLDAIYLDFKKAFDSVPHQRLLSKQDAYGISGQMKT